MSFFLVIIIAIVLLALWAVSLYNRLVRLRNGREQAFADVDVQLKQRHDMIPQLVEAVRGYMQHERGVLTEVTEARAAAMKATSINEKISAETRLSTALDGLKVAVEAYPDLKASQNFLDLQNEISDIENKIASARRFFNSATKELNVATEVFPSNIVATLFNFKREPMFDLGEQRTAVEEPPKIQF
ncbi:MAG TPA: LemA family protein [Bacteroidales bacterium]|jgi:LemA protein|nr:LemA family protein [Bacteroidales bacterium]OQB63740.1 MAG: LemA family protein [Bacteroidetes bacterium ADurb.Bin145]HOU01354.1 LemA family protein [Bacteroidales bacterium]HQG63063.1 LemA family protein [Bacteroidales bacterium]HQK67437.1 LemA family protein [Bacteroidales bacterium]